ncbi:MAG: RluA family pseudouridine synthase [Eubacteriales bacterium]
MKSIVVYEDDYLMVVHKSAGMATQTKRIGELDLVSDIRNYLQGGYVGLLNRLDQQVEGLVFFGKTSQVTHELSVQMQRGEIGKRYQALVVGEVRLRATLVHNLCKEKQGNLSRVVEKGVRNSKRACLHYEPIRHYIENSTQEKITLVAIQLETGRHHQIRVQLAHEKMPIIGDYKYGDDLSKGIGREVNIEGLALCAVALSFVHPIYKKKIELEVTPNWMKLTEKLQQI